MDPFLLGRLAASGLSWFRASTRSSVPSQYGREAVFDLAAVGSLIGVILRSVARGMSRC